MYKPDDHLILAFAPSSSAESEISDGWSNSPFPPHHSSERPIRSSPGFGVQPPYNREQKSANSPDVTRNSVLPPVLNPPSSSSSSNREVKSPPKSVKDVPTKRLPDVQYFLNISNPEQASTPKVDVVPSANEPVPSSSVAVQTKYDSGNKTATKNTQKKFAGIRFENLNEVESAKMKIEQPSSYASKLKASILNSKTGNRNIGNRNSLGSNSISSFSSSEKQEDEENQEQPTLFFSPSGIVDQEKVKRERKFQEDLFRVSKAIKIVELLPRLNNNNKSAEVSLYEFNRLYALMASITFFLFDLVAVDTKEIDIAFDASSTSEFNLELPSQLHTFLYWLFFSKLSDTLQAAFEELFYLHQGSRTLPTLLEFMRRMMLEQKEQAVRANTKEAADEREQAALLPEGFSYQKNRGGSGKGDSRYQGNSESSVRSMWMGASTDSGLLSRNRFSPSLSSPPKQQENAVPVQHSSSPLKRTLCTFCKFQTNHQVKDCPVRQATLCHQCFDFGHSLKYCNAESLLPPNWLNVGREIYKEAVQGEQKQAWKSNLSF